MSKTQEVIYKVVADINDLTGIVDALLKYTDKYQVRVNDAITAISLAWTHTYNYLRNEQGEYVPNQNLSDLWNEAASKTRLVNAKLARQLNDKARFWIHPDLPRQNNILKLKDITDEIERLEKKLR